LLEVGLDDDGDDGLAVKTSVLMVEVVELDAVETCGPRLEESSGSRLGGEEASRLGGAGGDAGDRDRAEGRHGWEAGGLG
jgi:hypothetical protein